MQTEQTIQQFSIYDKTSLFNFNQFTSEATNTFNIEFNENSLNVILRDLPKEFPFTFILFDGTKRVFEKELDMYDFVLLDYYDDFNSELEKYRIIQEEKAKQKIIDDEKARQDKILELKYQQDLIDSQKAIEEQRKAFKERYGEADSDGRKDIDKEIFLNRSKELVEIKQHNDRVRRQLNNRVQVAIANYDSKYLDCEISLFDKLRVDANAYLKTGDKSVFLTTYYNNNYSNKLTYEELCKKIIQNADKRDSHISSLISTMKEDLKRHIKE